MKICDYRDPFLILESCVVWKEHLLDWFKLNMDGSLLNVNDNISASTHFLNHQVYLESGLIHKIGRRPLLAEICVLLHSILLIQRNSLCMVVWGLTVFNKVTCREENFGIG